MSDGGNLIWSISSWSSSKKYDSNSIKFNNTYFTLSIIPNKPTFHFELALKQISAPSKQTPAQVYIHFMLDKKKKNCKFEVSYPLTEIKRDIDTQIPISQFDQYNGKDFVVNFSVLPPEKNSARPPSKASRNANNRNVNSRINNNKPLSTISSPNRGQSVKNINLGRQSNASTSSTSSTAAQNSVTRKNSFRSTKSPNIVQPKPNNSSKRHITKVATASNHDITSENSSNSKPRLPNDQNSRQQISNLTGSSGSSRKPPNASPAAIIAAHKATTNPTLTKNNLPATPISEPKTSQNSSTTSPSAAIATKNSLNSQTASSPNNLPPISHSPRNNQTTTSSQKVSNPESPTEVSTVLAPSPSPHPPEPEDSYAGLSNQGATCYMNSVLQSLFHIPLFRRSVFELPTDDETDKEQSIPLNLQALFCSLLLAPQELKEEQKKQSENKTDESNMACAYISKYVKPVSTKNLTKSFGWNSSETLQQQDIQEFFRVLLNKLDDKIDEKNKKSKEAKESTENEGKKNSKKDTKKQGKNENKTNNNDDENKEEVKHVSDIFKGQTIFTISGEKVDFKSERYEDFYDLSLSVKDCSNLENSFLQFTKKEQLSDSYDTGIEGHEKIAVQIQAQLFKLPKILTLHLQRFEYDFVHDSLTKIYDELKFPKVLDTTPFLHDLSPFKKQGKNCSTFTLTGVLIHSGDASFGHYYVYLRPKLVFNEDGSLNEEKSSFYEFNDSSVHRVTDEEAIDDNFGGCDNYLNGNNSYSNTYMSYKRHSAYMLIYSRNDCLHEIYDTSYEIPNYIKEYSKSCQRVPKSGKKIISYFTDDAIKMNTEDGKLGIYNDKAIQSIKISSDSSYEHLYNEIARILNCDASYLRLWKLDYYKDIDKWVPDSGKLSTILPKTVFVQYKPKTESTEVTKDQILLVIKLYTQKIEFPILYAASILFSRSSKVKELKKKISDILSLPNNAVVRLFEELPQSTYSKQFIEELTDDESTIFMSNKSLRSGSSIIVQTSIQPSNDILNRIYHSFKDQERINNRDYYEEILNYVDYMVANLPENLTDYIEMKRNVRRMRLLDYQRSSNSNYIKLKEIENYDNQIDLQNYGVIEFPYSIDLNQLIEFIEQIIPTKFDKSEYKIFLFRYSSRVDGPSPFPLKNISELKPRTQYLYTLIVPFNTPFDYRDKMTVNIAYSEDSFNLTGNLHFYSPVDWKVSKILDGFSWIKIKGKKTKPKLRALQIKGCKVAKILTGDETISIFNDSILRIEIVPESTEPFKELSVCNAVISGSASNSFYFLGFPFLLQVGIDETVDDTRKKISKNLKWNSEKMNHVRFYGGPEDEPFDLEKVLKKGQKTLECLDVEKGQRLIMIHSSEESFKDDYSSVTSGVQIH